jgi:signal transduction histidine kinase
MGVNVWVLRFTFAVFALIDGAGLVAYAAFWLLVSKGVSSPERAAEGRRSIRILSMVLPCLGLGLLIGIDGSSASDQWHIWMIALPCAGVAIGLAVLWWRAGSNWRSGWFAALGRPRFVDFAPGAAGALIVLGSIARLLTIGTSWAQTSSILLAALVLLAGAVLAVLPFLLRAVRELSAERAQRIRAQERAEVAALVHDSVLQTLTLIQRKSSDSAEVARLARYQERELREQLYGGPSRLAGESGRKTFAQAVDTVAAEVEDRYGVRVEVVTVGDAELDETVNACVAAIREATVNAAKYAAGAAISLYVQTESEDGRARSVEVYVRDRGPGFDLDAVSQDRMGIRESIVGRMQRHGGQATINTAPGDGTEVRLELCRD